MRVDDLKCRMDIQEHLKRHLEFARAKAEIIAKEAAIQQAAEAAKEDDLRKIWKEGERIIDDLIGPVLTGVHEEIVSIGLKCHLAIMKADAPGSIGSFRNNISLISERCTLAIEAASEKCSFVVSMQKPPTEISSKRTRGFDQITGPLVLQLCEDYIKTAFPV